MSEEKFRDVDMGKQNTMHNGQLLKFSSILVFVAILALATPLYTSAGYIMIGSLIVILIMGWKKISRKAIVCLALFTLIFVIYAVSSPSVWETRGVINTAITMFAMAVVMTIVFPDMANNAGMSVNNRGKYWLEFAYVIIWLIAMEQLIVDIYNNLGDGWNRRNLSVRTDRFIAGYHHVDFSVIVICVFLLGMKRGHYLKSMVLTVAAMIAIPTRTLQLFYLLFIGCWIFKQEIFDIVHGKMVKSSFWWMVLIVVVFAAFCFLWVFYMVRVFTIVKGHTGLYDDSNYVRFQTVLYALRVIWEKKLFLSGVSATATGYSTVTDIFGNDMNGPHNTYVSILLHNSVIFGGAYLYWVSKMVDKVMSVEMIPYIVPYLLCCCILHDMLSGARMFLYLAVLIVPMRKNKTRYALKLAV